MYKEAIEGFRLSPQQKHLWLLQQAAHETPYCAASILLIEGELEVAALEAALKLVVERHEILRTTFHCLPGMLMPLQVITDCDPLPIQHHDLSSVDAAMQSVMIEEVFEAIKQQAFDFQQGCALRASLVNLSPSRNLLLICLPAMQADAVSLKQLAREIASLYAARGGEHERAGEPMQYADLSEVLNELLESEETEAGREYWRGKEIISHLDTRLPLEDQYSSQDFAPQVFAFHIKPDVLTGIQSLTQRTGASTAAFLFACWQTLLRRLTRQPDLIVGAACDCRAYEGMEDALGLFARYLPVESQPEEKAGFIQVLKIADQTMRDAQKWQEYFSWEQISEQSQGATARFFPFCFDFEERSPMISAGGPAFSIYKQYVCYDRYKVRLACVEEEGAIKAELHYDSNLFSADDMARLAEEFDALSTDAIRRPESAIAELSILGDAERRKLLIDFNDTKVAHEEGRCLHELIREQAERTPHSKAVVFEDKHLTYAELMCRANQLASHLKSLGVGPESLVGLCVERSLEMVVGVLGVLKAGGAYIPLDPSYPEDRLSFMLRDSRATVLLTQERLKTRLQVDETTIICLDADWPTIAEQSDREVVSGVMPDNPVYVIYTSGSTGKPKGVMITHRAICNHMFWMQNAFPLAEADRVLQKTPFSFDASVWEFYAPLLAGAQLIMAPPGAHQDIAQLARLVADQNISTLQLVPFLLRRLLEEEDFKRCKHLKRVFCGGEPLTADIRERFFGHSSASLHNLYGPTETCVEVTAWTSERESRGWNVPIGRPIDNLRIYILDGRLEPVPIGCAGEIYIGGKGLGRGYLNRPELTAGSFVPDHFSAEPGARLYKTGDLARFLPNGSIEFLSRIDYQLKVRGIRVELGEIEAVIVEHPELKDAVVTSHKDGTGDDRIFAYAVPKHMPGPGINELQSFLKERLPDYMIPASWLLLDHLPLTPNGKLDRAALPLPAPDRSLIDSSFVAPVSQIQILLADIWADLLKLDRVGLLDNFFDLGGHSLLATQLISRVRDAFSVDLPLRRLLEEPSLHQMAAAVQQALSTGAAVSLPRITRADHSGPLPLSYAQQRLWFLHQLDPHSAAYNSPAALRLQGRLNVAALEATFTHLVSRHEVLRTVFATVDGQGCQIIHPPRHQTIPLVDLSGMDDKQREPEAQRLAQREALAPFELERGPVIRVLLVKLDEQDHALMVTLHHIVSDGWSMGVLVEEVSSLYSAYCKGERVELEPLCVQYSDYTLWQREWLVGEALARQMSYWREQLGTQVKAAELPPDRRRPLRQRHRGAICLREIDREVSRGFIEMSRREGVTLYMSLLAVFSSLLYRLSGEGEIVIGTPIAGRGSRELEGLIGFFANTLVMKVEVRGEERFKDLLRRVREVALGAYAHQEVPFEKVVEELQPERDLSRQALFQVVLSVQNAPVEELRMEGLEVRRMEVGARAAKFDVVMNVFEREGEMRLECEYDRELYEEGTMRVVMRQMERVMRGVVEGGVEQEVGEIRLESEEEERRWAREWNETEREYPCEKRMEEMIEEQAERTPEREAVRYRGEGISYRELEERANRLANHLIERGVREGERVGVCLSHSIEVVVAILGVMKSGASYVPVDVEHPLSRVEMVLEDAGVRQVIVDQEQADRFEGRQVIVLGSDKENEQVSQCSSIRPSVEAGAEGLAYIIYTSGSTGRPKGVKITHRSLVNYVWWARGVYQQGEALDFAFYSSLAFDLTVTSIFVPLVSGGRVVVYRREGKQELLKQIISSGEVDVVKLTPSHLKLIKEEDNRGSRVRRLIVGGEALESQLAREVYESFGGEVEIDNEYGPTEATVGCMHYRWAGERAEAEQRARVGIGVPAANTKIYVMDERGRCVGENQSGEIWIAGDCLSEGYLNREEETALRFVANPYEEGEVAYRSGDIARRLVGGELEYIGRRDEQVKYHGYRVEMGEIESELSKHEKVRESVVRVKKDGQGREVMVAYYVSREEVEGSELREHLRGRVIEEVIPSLYVRVKRMPLTINGKVDVRGLPGVEEIRERMSRKVKEEEGEREMRAVEEIVGGIWSEVLGLRGVGLRANFFELGGHSLMATQVVTRVREVLGVEIGLRSVFERPTVEGMVERIEQERAKRAGEEESRERKIKRREAAGAGGGAGGEEEEREMSYGQQRIWFMSEVGAGAGAYNVHTSLRMEGELDVAAMERVYNEVVRRHEVLRSVYEVRGGRCVQVVKEWKREVLAEIDVSEMEGEVRQREVRRVIECEARRGFELEKGPMIRVGMIKEREGERVMMVTMHHIASDGWSMGVMVREVVEMYEAYREGRESELGELEIQYGDYAEWQRERLRGEEMERQKRYWVERLGGKLPVLEMPTDGERPVIQSFRGGNEKLLMGEVLTERVKELSRREGVTLFMTLLAAFKTLVYRYTGQTDIIVGTPIANRNRVEIEGLIGYFANTLALRTQVNGDMSFRELLVRVREVALGAYDHQDLPFEKLVEELQPERDLSRSPIFQVVFVLQNAAEKSIELPGLTLKNIEISGTTSKFDLVINVTDTNRGLSVSLEYDTDLFQAATIIQLLDRYVRLLESIVADPQARLSDLELLSEEEGILFEKKIGIEELDRSFSL